jgi:hypothetical protein
MSIVLAIAVMDIVVKIVVVAAPIASVHIQRERACALDDTHNSAEHCDDTDEIFTVNISGNHNCR